MAKDKRWADVVPFDTGGDKRIDTLADQLEEIIMTHCVGKEMPIIMIVGTLELVKARYLSAIIDEGDEDDVSA